MSTATERNWMQNATGMVNVNMGGKKRNKKMFELICEEMSSHD